MTPIDELSRQIGALSAEMRVGFERLSGGHKVLEERLDHIAGNIRRTDKDVERLEKDVRQRLDTFDGELSDSQIHLLNEIKKERDELKKGRTDSGIWWKRTAVGTVLKITGFVVSLALTFFIGYLLHH
jgi:hypothetical protein